MTTSPRITTSDVQVGEHRLRVHASGDPSRPAVVWLHGSGPGVSALSNWALLLERFADRFYNLAPDILGFGESDHPEPAPVGMANYTAARARSVIALLDAVDVPKAHFVGNSMGGMITLTAAALAPERIDRMVLMGTGGAPLPPSPELMKMVSFYEDPSVEAMRALLTNFVHDTGLFAGELDEIAADRVRKAMSDNVRRSHLATFDPSCPPVKFSPQQLGSVTNQTLVVHGREDKMLPVQAGYYMAENIPNAQLHVLPHAGHWIQIEQVDRFAGLVSLFLGEPVAA